MRIIELIHLDPSRRSTKLVVAAFLYTAITLLLGYFAFGLLTSLIFSSGFLGGFDRIPSTGDVESSEVELAT